MCFNVYPYVLQFTIFITIVTMKHCYQGGLNATMDVRYTFLPKV